MTGASRELTGAERAEIGLEMERAARAIAEGNPGKARVCARRACGVALRSRSRPPGQEAAAADAVSLLRAAAADPGLDPEAREAAARLSAPAAGPAGAATVDPIADAKILLEALGAAPGAPL